MNELRQLKKLNEAYRLLLKKFDETREILETGQWGLCVTVRSLPPKQKELLLKEFTKHGIFNYKYKWSRTKKGYDARRRWIERRIREIEGRIRNRD